MIGSDFAFYASVYIEHNVGIYGQFYNAEIRSGEPTVLQLYNNSWVSTVCRPFIILKVIMDKCSEGGSEAGNYHTLGIAQILSAYNLATLTDMMGDVPMDRSTSARYNYLLRYLINRQDIYTAIFKFLDDAIANLDKAISISFFRNSGSDLWRRHARYGRNLLMD